MNKIISTKDRGFTIVELLVVIVVIGILAAITMVSYTGVTDKAKAAQSASNAATVASIAEIYFAECGSYPSIANLSTGCTANGNTPVSKLPGTITAKASALDALTTSNYTSNVIYVLEGTTGVCIANYDPTYTTSTSPNFTNLKVTLLGSATTGFSVNPNGAVATCS
ncbi:MAG TPA: prepilin-type N-terminal cleavage/methylation domain-containing protein [Candidatus Saccharibacteria bacterium]|nr:prepilin-type N-terminal cleavage/methylation domain-containing protein [Candidatus Saccharibacteria bacterium]